MKIKVDLSCVIVLEDRAGLYPVEKIEANMFECDELWDVIGEGFPLSHKNCVVRILEEHSND